MRWSFAVFVIVAGCGTDSIPIGELNAQLARAGCERDVRCGGYDTMERCLAAAPAGPITTSIEASVTAGLVDYDDEQAAECVAQRADVSCSWNTLSYRAQPSAICRGILRAGRRLGDLCAIDDECDSRNCSASCSADTCCIGNCVEAHHLGGLNENCSAIACAPDLWCDPADTQCEQLLPQGAYCFDPQSCGYGLDCANTCQPTPKLGDPCLLRTLTGEDPWCGLTQGLACDPATMTCQPSLGAGAACDPDAPIDRCAWGYLRCDPDTRTCRGFSRVGEPCTFRCEAGTFCSFSGEGAPSLCLPFVDDGSPCFGFPEECASGACDGTTGLCVEPAVCT